MPNYFEPFVQANVPIHCAMLRTTADPVRLVRGDPIRTAQSATVFNVIQGTVVVFCLILPQ